jgi:hypothetical protein
MSAIMLRVIDSEAQREALEALTFAHDSVGELKRLAGELVNQKSIHRLDVMNELSYKTDSILQRLDAFQQCEDKRQREARRKARADLAASLPDPDDPFNGVR